MSFTDAAKCLRLLSCLGLGAFAANGVVAGCASSSYYIYVRQKSTTMEENTVISSLQEYLDRKKATRIRQSDMIYQSFITLCLTVCIEGTIFIQ